MTYDPRQTFSAQQSAYGRASGVTSSKSNANKQAAKTMKAAGIGGLGGRPTTSAAQRIQDKFRRETQRDDDRSKPATPQKNFLGNLLDRVKSSIIFAGGDPERKRRPDPNPGALYTASPFIIPAATAVTAATLGPAPVDADATGMPSIYTPDTREFGTGIQPMEAPEKPESAKIDIFDPFREKVQRSTAPSGLMSPPQPKDLATTPDMADAINRTIASVTSADPDVPYVIQAGDTLSDIARKTGTTVDDLVKENRIEDKDKIYTGNELKIPSAKSTKTKKDIVSSLIKGYERGSGDIGGTQVASSGEIVSDSYDPDSEFYQSFTQGITPPEMTQQTGAGTYATADDMTELEILARTIEAEAAGESKEGKLAVGAVIANRADSTKYGMDIRGVILKKAQFSPWNAITGYQKGISQAKPMLTEEMTPSEDSYEAAKEILSGDYVDPTDGATHYLNPKVGKKPKWYNKFKERERGTIKIGRHEFGNADSNKKYDGKDWINTRMQESIRPKRRPLGRP